MSIPSLSNLRTKDANSKPDTPDPDEIIVPLVDTFLTVVSYFESNTHRMGFMTDVRQSVVEILSDPTKAYKSHTIDDIFTKETMNMVVMDLHAKVGAPRNDTFDGMFTPTVEKERHVLRTDVGLSPSDLMYLKDAFVNGDLNTMCNLIAMAFVAVVTSVSRSETQYGRTVYLTASAIVFLIRIYFQARATTETSKAKLGAIIALVMDLMAYAYIGLVFMGYEELNAFFQWIMKSEDNQVSHVIGSKHDGETQKVVLAETLKWSLSFIHSNARRLKVNNGSVEYLHRVPTEERVSKMEAIEELTNKFFDSEGTRHDFWHQLILRAIAYFATYNDQDIPGDTLKGDYLPLMAIQFEHITMILTFCILRVLVYQFLQDWSFHIDDIQTQDMRVKYDDATWKPKKVIEIYNIYKNDKTRKHRGTYLTWSRQQFTPEKMKTLIDKYRYIFDDHYGRIRSWLLWTKSTYSEDKGTKFHTDLHNFTNRQEVLTFSDVFNLLVNGLEVLTGERISSSYYETWIEYYSWILVLTANLTSLIEPLRYQLNVPRLARRSLSPTPHRPSKSPYRR
jgi:hypothetical protein